MTGEGESAVYIQQETMDLSDKLRENLRRKSAKNREGQCCNIATCSKDQGTVASS
jgi:hypothetical protein